MKAKVILFWIASLLSLSLIVSVNQALAAEGVCFKPNVPIPGMSAIFGAPSCADGLGYTIGTDAIGKYVNALYTYSARLAAIVAMFMVVFASWQWMMAAGNSSKIENAKETIQGALLGLALLFAGQLLLNSISSQLVDFKDLNVHSIDPINEQANGNPCANANTLFPNNSCGDKVRVGDYDCVITKACSNGPCYLPIQVEVDNIPIIKYEQLCPSQMSEALYPTSQGWSERCQCKPNITITVPPANP